jgi:hypothetical protein
VRHGVTVPAAIHGKGRGQVFWFCLLIRLNTGCVPVLLFHSNKIICVLNAIDNAIGHPVASPCIRRAGEDTRAAPPAPKTKKVTK